jgi:hypothetical protein
VRRAWAPPFMESARRLGASSFVCESLLVGGRTLEEGVCLAGTRSSCATSDLTGSSWRRHTTTCLCARVSSLGKGGGRAH